MSFKWFVGFKHIIGLLFYLLMILTFAGTIPDIIENRYIQDGLTVLAAHSILDAFQEILRKAFPLILFVCIVQSATIFILFLFDRRKEPGIEHDGGKQNNEIHIVNALVLTIYAAFLLIKETPNLSMWGYGVMILALGYDTAVCWNLVRAKRTPVKYSNDRRPRLHMLLRLRYIPIVILIVFLPLLVLSKSVKRKTEENVLLIIIDTLRADHVGCYGYSRLITPTIDMLSKDGVIYNHVYAQSSWTKTAVASLMTGLYPSQHNVYNEFGDYCTLPREITTLSEILKNAGYTTVGISANPHIIPEYGFDQGFSHFFRSNNLWTTNSTRAVTDFVTRYLKSREGLKGTFLYIHYMDPHDPYSPLIDCENFSNNYEPENVNIKRGIAFKLSGEWAMEDKLRTGAIPIPMPMTEQDLNYLVSLYDCEIRQVDEGLGEILRALEETGARDNTTIIVTADHGEEFLDHEMLRHGYQLYEETVKVPLIIYKPGFSPPVSKVEKPVELIDLFPTILSIFDVPLTGDIDGHILPPFNASRLAASDAAILGMTRFRNQNKAFLLERDLKLIKDFISGRSELFDLSKDPMEKHDLAEDNREMAQKMSSRLDDAIARSTRIIDSPDFKPPDNEALKEMLRTLGYVE